jgi:hypothetical protein
LHAVRRENYLQYLRREAGVFLESLVPSLRTFSVLFLPQNLDSRTPSPAIRYENSNVLCLFSYVRLL